ncbi:MAG: hypothetical protein JJE50_13450 [Actinomycetales bacterium]|nr:hypothetical protein [Actinomycetales bacterium]
MRDSGPTAEPSLAGHDLAESVDRVLGHLDGDLGADPDVAARITRIAGELVP